jgi:hypothetical protein
LKQSPNSAVILAVLAVAGGGVLNFKEFLMGSPANQKNILVTLAFVAVWLFVLKTAARVNTHGIVLFSAVYWSMTLIFSILTAMVNLTHTQVDWAIPFVILLIGPWYGLHYFTRDFFATALLIAFASLGVLIAVAVIVKRKIADKSGT